MLLDLPRLRGWPRRAWRRVQPNAWPILQTATAAGGAWFFAQLIPGHRQPIFAPIAAVVAMTAGRGRRGRAAVQLIFGVAFGIALSSLLVRAAGIGPWQLILIVGLTMAGATAVGLPSFMVTQSGVWAVIVVTGTQGHIAVAETRLVDALVGGGVALILAQLLFPIDPLDVLDEAARDTRREIDEVLEQIAAALRERDDDRALAAVGQADDIDVRRLADAVELGREVVRRAPRRRRARRRIEEFAELHHALQGRARHTRVLAVAAVRALRADGPPPPELAEAVERLACGDAERALEAVRRLDASAGMAASLAAQQIERLAGV